MHPWVLQDASGWSFVAFCCFLLLLWFGAHCPALLHFAPSPCALHFSHLLALTWGLSPGPPNSRMHEGNLRTVRSFAAMPGPMCTTACHFTWLQYATVTFSEVLGSHGQLPNGVCIFQGCPLAHSLQQFVSYSVRSLAAAGCYFLATHHQFPCRNLALFPTFSSMPCNMM